MYPGVKPREITALETGLVMRIKELERALLASVDVVKAWHGSDGWDIHYNHSSEMKPARDALGNAYTP